MDLFHKFLFFAVPVTFIELLAALVGIYYLRNHTKTKKLNKYFVIFLWYTFFNELIAAYAPIAYFSDYNYFGFVKDTIFEKNIWLYNIYYIVNFSFLIYYFNNYLPKKSFKKAANYLVIFYIISSIVFLNFTDVFYKSYSNYSLAVGVLLLLASILKFYLRLLKTDKIIDLKKYLPIYLSIGLLVLYLCVTPLDVFSKYFKTVNEVYVNIRINVLLIANIFMYSTFIIGFFVCAKKDAKGEVVN